MSRKYKFRDNENLYFVSFSVVNWIDVFIRIEYKEILLDSWRYCQKNKGLDIFAWCIMTSHIHMIICSHKDKLQDIMRDMKSHTSNKMKSAIKNNPQESRKVWMLRMMKEAGKANINNKDFQFWQQHNHPIVLDSNELMEQKLNYIHYNPVKAGFVSKPEDYIYSSALDYTGEKGLIDIILIE